MALIFSFAMLSVPYAELIRITSHSHMVSLLGAHSPFLAAFAARYGGLVLTLAGRSLSCDRALAGNTVASHGGTQFWLVFKKARDRRGR